MIKASEAVKYFEQLYAGRAVYLWGANGEVINQALCDKLFKTFGNSTYSKAYYDRKLAYGKGRIGADCSGAFRPISGFDDTAQGYYNRCIKKGKIGQIQSEKACLVFKGKSEKRITHIGLYLGNGNVIEMKSSKDDCVKRTLKAGKWDYFGIPDWIDYGGAAEPKKEPLPVLRIGSKGAYVTSWQNYLTMCGFYKAEVDGIFGQKTEQAVREWQKANGLVSDGVIGPKSWAKLNLS